MADCQSCHAIHAAGDAIPMGRPLEARHLAALEGVRLRLDDAKAAKVKTALLIRDN